MNFVRTHALEGVEKGEVRGTTPFAGKGTSIPGLPRIGATT